MLPKSIQVFLFLAGPCLSKPLNDDDENDVSGHLGPLHNQGAPLYYDTGHQNYEEEYPGYDGYASYAPHHDHEHYAYPRYKFEYGVHDPHTGDIKKQYEERDGDVVRGYYSLVEPDGSIRIVEYTADDKHGFQATVRKIGPSHHPPPHHHHHHPHPHPPSDHHYYPKHNDHSYEDQYYYPPAQPHNTYYDDDGEHGYYGQKKYRRPPVPSFGDFNHPYQYAPGSAEYEESDDYPYHSNINYPVYVLPKPSYAPIQELTAYDALEKDFENPDKLYKKRSPYKKTDKSFKLSPTEKSKVELKPELKPKEAQKKEDRVDKKDSENSKSEKPQVTLESATTPKSSKVQTEKPKDKS
ncbi:hypothetical protein V9T40_003598 [Parthenolecanium corni]|uniref:Uncharacterized protein n=1 Tax=Parthenolecanium corni TaxID=536013 RepID=A0AAN9U184_9HEMI